jgi:hypothetical protein
MHRDQKLSYDPVRDAPHVKKHPNAFSMERCYQSSLYMTDSTRGTDDGFVCCPGSHLWDDTPDWISAPDRHHVAVPQTDPRVSLSLSKLIVYAGEMIMWDSRLAHMGGWVKKETIMRRLDPLDHDDFQGIQNALDVHGVCVIKDVASKEDMDRITDQLRHDVASIYGLPVAPDWKSYPQACYGRPNKGGGSWGPVACTKAAWDARLLPRRVAIFQSLLGTEDIVVSLDSVHWSVDHPRLSFMASFAPRATRSLEAYRRKCVSQAYGLTRTTHWANLGDISMFNYGGERNNLPQRRFESVSKDWKGYGSRACAPDTVRRTYVKQVAKVVSTMSGEDLLDEDVSRWL